VGAGDKKKIEKKTKKKRAGGWVARGRRQRGGRGVSAFGKKGCDIMWGGVFKFGTQGAWLGGQGQANWAV